MSNGLPTSEERTILAAVESLERGIEAPGGAPRDDEAAETLARLYTEVLGLIPFELEPVAPGPEIRGRLLASIHGDETQPAGSQPLAAVPPRSSQEARPPRAVPAPPSAAARWPLALAATLCFVLLGLSAWLYLQMGQQGKTIARLQEELIAERHRAEEAAADGRKVQASELDLREKFALVTSPAVEVSPMRPPGEAPLQPGARGVLFVAADHQHWYLSLKGLQPAAPGKTYKLWFVADQGPVSAGSFTAQPGAPVELSSKTMPAGTQETLVTLEDDPEAATPSDRLVLRSAAPYLLG